MGSTGSLRFCEFLRSCDFLGLSWFFAWLPRPSHALRSPNASWPQNPSNASQNPEHPLNVFRLNPLNPLNHLNHLNHLNLLNLLHPPASRARAE